MGASVLCPTGVIVRTASGHPVSKQPCLPDNTVALCRLGMTFVYDHNQNQWSLKLPSDWEAQREPGIVRLLHVIDDATPHCRGCLYDDGSGQWQLQLYPRYVQRLIYGIGGKTGSPIRPYDSRWETFVRAAVYDRQTGQMILLQSFTYGAGALELPQAKQTAWHVFASWRPPGSDGPCRFDDPVAYWGKTRSSGCVAVCS